PPDDLPQIPVPLAGDFSWLKNAQPHKPSVDGNPSQTKSTLKALLASNQTGLPPDFVSFFRSPRLWTKIRSCTDCYLSLDSASTGIRGGLGRLVRFMSDSQDCIHWNLYISPCETKHGVVATYFYAGTDRAQEQGCLVHPRDITLCADSFEEFMFRFWLENELWFALHDDGTMPEFGEEYLAYYRRGGRPKKGQPK